MRVILHVSTYKGFYPPSGVHHALAHVAGHSRRRVEICKLPGAGSCTCSLQSRFSLSSKSNNLSRRENPQEQGVGWNFAGMTKQSVPFPDRLQPFSPAIFENSVFMRLLKLTFHFRRLLRQS